MAASTLAGSPLPVLANTAVFGGVANNMVIQTEAGAPAALYVSSRSTGTTCPSLLKPACLSMAKAFFLGKGNANGSGELVITGNAPSGFPGDAVSFQVASILSTGGAISPVITLPYYDTCQAPTGLSVSGDEVLIGQPVVVNFADPVAPYFEFMVNGELVDFVGDTDAAELGFTMDTNTAYTVTAIDPCDNEYEFSFFTQPNIETFGDSLIARGWVLDFTGASIAPASLDAFKADLLGAITDPIVVGVADFDEENSLLYVSLGYGVDNGGTISQNVCLETTEFPNADFSAEPTVSASVVIPDFADLLDYAEIDATFAPDGASLGDVELRAWVTAQAAAELAGLVGFDDTVVCSLLPLFVSGVSCVTCPVTPSAQCVQATITGIVGNEIDGGYQLRSAEAIALDPTCAP